MSFMVESDNKQFKLVPAGSHLARCYRIIDMGTQESEWNGEKKFQRKVMIGWEMHGEDDAGDPLKTDEGKPLAIFKNYTLSWAENSNLRKDLQSWRGSPWSDAEASRFDLQSILDKWCMVNIIHAPGKNNKIYANVDGISPVPPIIRKNGFPDPINETQIFRLADPDWNVYETLSKNTKAKIEASPEFRALKKKPSEPQTGGSGFDDMADDIPFN
jgi:hypothetical protein